jgi:hypothetical protein
VLPFSERQMSMQRTPVQPSGVADRFRGFSARRATAITISAQGPPSVAEERASEEGSPTPGGSALPPLPALAVEPDLGNPEDPDDNPFTSARRDVEDIEANLANAITLLAATLRSQNRAPVPESRSGRSGRPSA